MKFRVVFVSFHIKSIKLYFKRRNTHTHACTETYSITLPILIKLMMLFCGMPWECFVGKLLTTTTKKTKSVYQLGKCAHNPQPKA